MEISEEKDSARAVSERLPRQISQECGLFETDDPEDRLLRYWISSLDDSVRHPSSQERGIREAQAPPPFSILWSLLRFIFVELVMLPNHLILCHPLLLLPSIFPSIRVFSNKLALYVKWPKYWSFSFRISPSNEYSGLILNIEYSGWPLSMGLFKDVIFKKQLEISFEQLNFLWKTIRIVYKTLWKCIPDTKIEFGLSLCMLVIGTQIIGELFIFKPGSLEDK